MNMITTDKCETCKNGIIEEESKARIYVNCTKRKRRYSYGQCIPCDDYDKKKEMDTL